MTHTGHSMWHKELLQKVLDFSARRKADEELSDVSCLQGNCCSVLGVRRGQEYSKCLELNTQNA